MARFDRLTVYNTFLEDGLIPLFYHPDAEVAINVADALAAGGARVLEFTNRGDQALAVFQQLNAHLQQHHPHMILGVGSVIDAPTAALYAANGANFIVSPVFVAETALLCNRRKLAYMPGCGSASEISEAESYGVEICKIFPGSQVGGPGFIKAVKGPMPWSRLMPTGGVDATEESLRGWINAGACAVGMGSKLVVKSDVENGDFAAITARVKQCRAWIAAARK